MIGLRDAVVSDRSTGGDRRVRTVNGCQAQRWNCCPREMRRSSVIQSALETRANNSVPGSRSPAGESDEATLTLVSPAFSEILMEY